MVAAPQSVDDQVVAAMEMGVFYSSYVLAVWKESRPLKETRTASSTKKAALGTEEVAVYWHH